MLDGCLEERPPDTPAPCTGGYVYSPDRGLVAFFHFGRADQSDHADKIGAVVLPENGLLIVVTEEGSNRFAHKADVIVGRRPERQRVCFQRFPTEHNEGVGVRRTKPTDIEFHTHLEAKVEVSDR